MGGWGKEKLSDRSFSFLSSHPTVYRLGWDEEGDKDASRKSFHKKTS